MKETETIFEMY